MDSGSSQPQPVLCAAGCGFWGNAVNLNLCSKCHREHVARQKEHAAVTAATTAVAEAATPQPPPVEDRMDLDTPAVEAPAPEPPVASLAVVASLPAAAPSPVASPPPVSAPIAIPAPASSPSPMPGLSSSEPSGSEPGASSGSSPAVAGSLPDGKASNRCSSCSKKVGLTGFKCRCAGVFCSTHRYSDKHDCSFDYKAAGREAIAKANPTVIASKVDKI